MSYRWIRQLPLVTLALAALAGMLMLLPQSFHEVLYFDHAALASGQWWSLISGHWVHADYQHLVWNLVALVALGGIIEVRSRRLLLFSLAVGMLSVDLLLYSPFNSVQRYCGLSGLLNTLLGVALYIYWHETRSRLVVAAGLLCVGKILVEMSGGQALFTNNSWPAYPIAHLAGLMGSLLLIGLYHGCRSFGKNRVTQPGSNGSWQGVVVSDKITADT